MLMVNPMDALIFTITFFILQQIEGNLIYPYVVGNSVGLPSIWVLVAVTVGGSMMGIVGMLIFIPLCSVLYALLRDGVNARLRKKGGGESVCEAVCGGRGPGAAGVKPGNDTGESSGILQYRNNKTEITKSPEPVKMVPGLLPLYSCLFPAFILGLFSLIHIYID